jgi:hypothetical protein
MTRRVRVLDAVDAPPCPNCGVPAWILDSSGGPTPTYNLLCIDPFNKGCLATADVPSDVVVIPDDD